MQKFSILVTGYSGMVGCNIVNKLNASNFYLITPTHTVCDLIDRLSTKEFIKNNKPYFIIHCAGKVGGIQANVNNPTDFLYENMQIGMNLIKSALESGVKYFLNLGSSCMYPHDAPNPLKEELVLTGELEPTNEGYALAKCAATRFCQYINRQYPDFHYKTLIPCNLYGKYDKFGENAHMIPAIIKKIDSAIKNNEDTVEIWGDGAARREFMYAEDLAECVKLAVENFEELPELMNVGLGYDYTVNEYYEAVAKVLGYKGRFVHNLDKPAGMKQKLVDISRQTKFGFKPKTSLEEGIRKTYEYYKSIQTQQ